MEDAKEVINNLSGRVIFDDKDFCELQDASITLLDEYSNLKDELDNKDKEIEELKKELRLSKNINKIAKYTVDKKDKIIDAMAKELIHMDDYGRDWLTEEYNEIIGEDEKTTTYLKHYFENKVKESR